MTTPRISYENLISRVRAAVAGPVESTDETTVELEAHAPAEAVAPEPAQPTQSKITKSNLFTHPDAHPVILDVQMIYTYGAEWLDWEPETVRWGTRNELGPMSDLAWHKLMACAALHRTNAFWQRWEVFTWCSMPFNNMPPDFDYHQVPTVADLLVAVDVANALRDDVQWSSEIRTYVQTAYKHDGLFMPLPPCDFVTLETSGLPFNAANVSTLWPSVRRTGVVPPGLTDGDADQLQRMLLAYEYQAAARARLQAQVALVEHK